MTFKDTDRFLNLLRAHGVSHFKSNDFEVSFGPSNLSSHAPVSSDVRINNRSVKKAPPSQAAPPVESQIPHHINEVQKLLKLSDEDLVDRMFPDPNFPAKDE